MKTFRMNPKSLRFKRHYFPIDGIYVISITDLPAAGRLPQNIVAYIFTGRYFSQ